MRGHRLIISVLAGLSFTLAVVMVALNLYPSWSQYARSLEEPILLATLSAISSMFLIRSFTHPDKDRQLLRVFNIPVRIEHLNRYSGFFFIGVLCTPVTHPTYWVEMTHMVLTGLALLTSYVQLAWWYKTKYERSYALVGVSIGIIGFLLGYLVNLYSVGVGELIAAIPILIFILKTNK